MAGELYEVKLSALIFLRAITKEQEFCIASNMKAAGCFDDVVFTMGDKTVFLQLKHKENTKVKIHLSQMFNLKGDFSLLKYCKSYIEIKQQWEQEDDLRHCGKFEDCLFVIYTNASMNDGIGCEVANTQLHDIISSGGRCIHFTEEHDSEIFHIFENLHTYKEVLTEAISNEEVLNSPELLEAVQKFYKNNTKTIPSVKELQKLLTYLESLGDLSDFREFLLHLNFCTKQAAEKQLSDMIWKEITKICGTDLIFDKFLQGVQDWWRNSDTFLTSETQFWQDIVQMYVANITDHKLQKLLSLNIEFIESECQGIIPKLSTSCRILLINSNCTTISCLKVQQKIKTKLVVDTNILGSHLTEILVIWKLGICGNILIIEGADNALVKLAVVLKGNSNKKIVIATSNSDIMQSELLQQFEYETARDEFTWKQLSSVTQSRILDSEIFLQGYPVTLALLAEQQLLQNISANVVLDILTDQNKLHIGCMVNELNSPYITRTFLRKEALSEDILYDKEIGHLAITGMSVEDLQSLIPTDEKICRYDCKKLSHLTGILDYRYFIINNINDFIALGKIYRTVHWIHRCNGRFLWRNSKGDVTLIKNYLLQETSTYANIQDVMRLPHQMVLLAAQPGMGKSTELSHLTSLLKCEDPSMWIVRVNLYDHLDYLSQTCPNALELLVKASKLTTQFERSLLEYQIQKKGNIVVLFDGYDEVSPKFSEKVVCMLRKLSNTKIRNIFITSRPVMSLNLERELCTLSLLLQPFTENDQKQFLLSMWNIPPDTSYDMSEFITELLNLTARSINDTMKEFTGIPLQTTMLAEVFQDDALHYIKTGEMKIVHKLDLLYLYNGFVDKKWQLYFKKMNLDILNAGVFEVLGDMKPVLLQSHMHCALVTLLNIDGIKKIRNSKHIMEDYKNFVQKFKAGHNKIGIITDVVHDKVMFVHNTFAEYFVGKWFSENIFSVFDRTPNHFYRKWYNAVVWAIANKGLKQYFRDEIFFTFQIMRKIFNMIIAEDQKLHMAVLNENTILVKSLLRENKCDVNELDRGGRTALHLAVTNFLDVSDDENGSTKTNAEEVVCILLEHGANPKIEDKLFFWSPLRLAVKVKAWFVVDLLLEEKVDHKDLSLIKQNIQNDMYLKDMLRMAAEKGLVRLLGLILKCGISIRLGITARHCSNCTMLHIAARHGHLRFVQLLIDHKEDTNSQECSLKRTPVMWAVDHGEAEVVEFLVSKKGTDVNACDTAGNTAMFLALKRFYSKYNQDMVTMKVDSEAQLTEQESDSCNEWKIIEILLQSGANFSTSDRNGDTVLHIAAMYGKQNYVTTLLKMKVDLTMKNKYGETALLAAAKSQRWDTVILLLKNGSDVNDCDENKDTVVHIAARYGSEMCLKFLREMKVNLNVKNKFNETPLLVAAKSRQWGIVALLLKIGCNITDFDEFGNTVLHMAARFNNEDCINMLLDLRADVNVKNNRQETPLLTAALFKNWNIVRLLLQHNADITACNKNEDSVLHLAARYGYIECVQLLADMKVDLNMQNKCHETALAIAAVHGNWDIVALLLRKGAMVTVFRKSSCPVLYLIGRYGNADCIELLFEMNIRDQNYNTVLHVACRYGNEDGVMRLLNRKVNVNEKNNNEETPILLAAHNKQWKTVAMLLNHGADVSCCDKNGNTVIHFAAKYGNTETILFLLRMETNLEVRNRFNETPLITAAYNCEWEIVTLLLQHGANVMSCDKHGNTIFHTAAAFGNEDCTKLLLKMNANLNIKNSFEETPIMTAAESKEWEIVTLLLNHGADLTSCNRHGNSVLHIAAKHGNKECVILLLQMKANLHVKNKFEETPLITAASNDKWEIVNVLLENGANLTDCDRNGNNLLHFAAKCGNKEQVTLLLDMKIDMNSKNKSEETPLVTAVNNNKWDIVKLFFKNGIDAEAYGSKLHGAISCGDIKCVSSFLECGLNVNCIFSTGVTPLWVAAYLGQLQVAELLCSHGADLHAEYPAASYKMGGYTPLHIAASCGKAKLVKCLLDRGANLMACDSKGQTALHVAATRGELRVVQCLLQQGASLDACDAKGLNPLQSATVTVKDPRNCDIRSRVSAVIQFLENYDGNPNNILINHHIHTKCKELNYVCM